MKITVYTIVYNEYGRFIPQWVEWLKLQTFTPEIMIILGKNHGADIQYLKDNNIKYYTSRSDNMGKLRNIALNNIDRDSWKLYFSVDDELLPTACEKIVNAPTDVYSLKFRVINPNNMVVNNCMSPVVNEDNDLKNWRKYRWGGYVAHKDPDVRYDEKIEIPNLLLHFELYKNGNKSSLSEEELAVCHRWQESHGFRTEKTKVRIDVGNYIDKYVEEYLDNRPKDITLFTIVYNEYGRFIPQWVERAKTQNKPFDDIIVVLGKNHGADIQYLKDNNIKYYTSRSNNMGKLRNIAIDKAQTEYVFYFSADDELYPFANTEISQYIPDYDAIGVRFNIKKSNGSRTPKTSAVYKISEIKNWRQHPLPGYVVFRRIINGVRLRYTETALPPNFPLLFELAYQDAKCITTATQIADHNKRVGSHGDNATKEHTFRDEFSKEIDKYATKCYDRYIQDKRPKISRKVKQYMVLNVLERFRDKQTNIIYRPSKQHKTIKMPYDPVRLQYMEDKGLVKLLSIEEEVTYSNIKEG